MQKQWRSHDYWPHQATMMLARCHFWRLVRRQGGESDSVSGMSKYTIFHLTVTVLKVANAFEPAFPLPLGLTTSA